MGCFNSSGFFSHLPLQCGDEMVAIVCYGSSNGKISNLPINCNSSLTPICAPIFGKYNDYGSIQDVVDDNNYMFFQDKLQISINWLFDFLHDKGCLSYNDLELYEENKEKEYKMHSKERNLNRYIIESDIKDLEDATTYRLVLKKIFKDFYGDWENQHLCIIMERKDVYDTIVNASSKYCYYSKKYIENVFDDLISRSNAIKSLCDKIGLKTSSADFSIFRDNEHFSRIEMKLFDIASECNDKKWKEYFAEFKKYKRSSFPIEFNYIASFGQGTEKGFDLYNDFEHDWNGIKDNLIDFCLFAKALNAMGAKFELSSYSGQDTFYKMNKEILESMLDIVTKKIDKEVDEE